MKTLIQRIRLLAVATLLVGAGQAFGQSWTFEAPAVSGQPGDPVAVDFEITHTGTEEAFTVDIQLSNPGLFSSFDLSSCLDNFPPAFIETCAFRAAPNDDTIRINWSSDAPGNFFPNSTVIAPFTFTIDPGATAGDSSDLLVTAVTAAGTVTEVDGSVTVSSGPQSALSLTPAAINFGVVDLGNMPQTDTFTLENTGDSGTTVNVSGVTYTGDAEFTVLSDGCTGSALAAADTCDVTIEFDAGANGVYSGQIDVASDADTNPTPTGTIDGEADSVANLSVNPPFGPVNLGTVVVGSSASANGSISNGGSAPGDFTCSLAGDPEISVSPSPLTGTVPAGGSTDFSISCTVPDTAVEGDLYAATLSCSGDNGFSGTHDISCGATEFEPLPVPTNSTWGLAILTLMMLMIGGFAVRYFRA